MTTIEIPHSVEIIQNNAFSSCRSLTTITIPESVTLIGEDAFEDCEKLTNVEFLGTKNINCNKNAFEYTKVNEIKVTKRYDDSTFCEIKTNPCLP